MKGLEGRDAHTRTTEGGIDELATLDFYRSKENVITRHLDDARKISLATLALMTQAEFETKAQLPAQYHDRLDMKRYLKASELPTINDASSIEEFKTIVDEVFDATMRSESLHKEMGAEEYEKYLARWNTGLDRWEAFVADLRAKYAANNGVIDVSNNGIVVARNAQNNPIVSRFNIKVAPTEMPVEIIMNITARFEQNPHILNAGFQMKTLLNEPNDRDGVIVYSTAAAFPHIVRKLRSMFRGNHNYHDRHAEPAIFGGINLKDADGTDFPSIRICVEPKSIGADFITFNDMQASILSEALIAYIHERYGGNKDALLLSFLEEDDAIAEWDTEFPNFYNEAAKRILGENINTRNIAFFAK